MRKLCKRVSGGLVMCGAVGVCGFTAPFALAVDRTWNNGSGNGDFFTTTNWSPVGSPAPDDNLTIGFGTLTAFESPSIANGGSLLIEGASTEVSFPPRGFLDVGETGTGLLTVRGGATLNQINSTNIGDEANSVGTMRVDGLGTVANLDTLTVGLQGHGTLEVTNGGVVNTTGRTWIMLNGSAGGSGEATVTGQGSALNVGPNGTASLFLGANGQTGVLRVIAGGAVASADADLGVNGGRGEVTVSGIGSRWDVGGLIEVGAFGAGSLDLADGAVVTAGSLGAHALTFQGVGTSTIDVTGNGTLLDVAGDLQLGQGLDISNTGPGALTVEQFADVNVGGTLRVKSQGTLNVAELGQINAESLVLEPGATLTTGPNSNVNVNALSGLGFAPTLNGSITFGHSGGTANHTIDNGGVFFVNRGFLVGLDAAPVGSVVTVTNNTIVDSGSINLGFRSGDGTIVIESDGEVRNFFGAIIAGSPGNRGEVVVRGIFSSNTLTLGPDFGTPPTEVIGRVLVEQNGSARASTSTVNPGGAITLRDNATFVGDSVTLDGGVINLEGGTFTAETVAGSLTNAAGRVAPGLFVGTAGGDATGTMEINGDYTQDPGGTLALQIGGAIPGTGHDRVNVGGFASLGGTLEISLVDGFVPTLGNIFGIVSATGGFNAAFHTLDLPDLSAQDLAWRLNPGGATLFLEVVANSLTGDYNGDGFVSQADLDLVLLNWGDGVLPGGFDPASIPGGGGFDGLISQNELDGVLLNWGNGTPPTPGSVNAIPEPASAVLLAGLWGLTSRSRRRG